MTPPRGGDEQWDRSGGYRPFRSVPRWFRTGLLVGLLLGQGALWAAPARAQDPSAPPSPGADRLTWGIQPSTPNGPTDRAAFELTLEPGEDHVDYIGVSNYSERPIDLVLYASDAFNTADGSFALLSRDEPPTDVGAWIRLQETAVTIPARTRLDIPFLLSVPDNATPGDHVGGIVAALESQASDGSGGNVLVERRIGTRVYLRVDGPLEPSLTVESVEGDFAGSWHPLEGILHLRYVIRNDGNVRLSGRQTITVDGPFGGRLKELRLSGLPEILPGESLPVTFDLPQVPPAGVLTTTVLIEPMRLDEPGIVVGEATEGSATTLAIPWMALGIALIVVELVAGGWWWRRRQQRRTQAKLTAAHAAGLAEGRSQATPPPEGDA